MESILSILPLILILLFLPLAVLGKQWEARLPQWSVVIALGGIFVFFAVSAMLQPDLRYNNLLFALFALVLMYHYYKKRGVGKSSDVNE